MRMLFAAALAVCVASACQAQEWSAEGHGEYARTTQTHQSAWGAGASIESLWGATHAALRLGTSLGADVQKQGGDAPTQWSVSYDATLEPGGSAAVTPYIGGSVSANWLTGNSATDGALLGLQYILGVELKPSSRSTTSVKVELRPGYVRTQEHSITWRAGLSFSL
jgi:opacity protein-like surface antigen